MRIYLNFPKNSYELFHKSIISKKEMNDKSESYYHHIALLFNSLNLRLKFLRSNMNDL